MDRIENNEAFVITFMPLYFKTCDEYPDSQGRSNIISYYGLTALSGTDYDAEQEIMKLYHDGKYDVMALAWKAGKVCHNSEKQLFFADKFEKDNGYSIGKRGNIVLKESFDDYLKRLNGIKSEIKKVIESKGPMCFSKVYDMAMFPHPIEQNKKSNTPTNFGPVNIINALFFISSGAAPIYDSFAHKAVRALAMNIAPKSVFMGANPDKTDTESVIRMYGEYMCLLKKLFPEYIYKDGSNEFIPRELDRALWVYGHSDRAWESND